MKQYRKHVSALILGAVLTFSLLGTAVAASGDLDPTFGTGGIVTTDFRVGGKVVSDLSGESDYGYAAAIQTDGKIIVAGSSYNSDNENNDFSLARYNVDGTLDEAFGSGEPIMTDFGGDEDGRAIAIQTDGKIIVAGSTEAGDFALARYNTDGTLDTTFDTDGMVTTDFGGYDQAYAVTVQTISSVDYIVVAGSSYSGGNANFALARYNSVGSLDTTFDTDGMVTTDFGGYDYARAVAIQTIGGVNYIVAAGATGEEDFALARYNSNGSLDTSFDTDGMVTTDIGETDEAYTITIQADGKIVAAGYTYVSSGTVFALARYNSNGSLDTTFDTDGMVTTDFGNSVSAYAVAIQTDNKIIAAGNSSGKGNSDLVLARYNSDGSLDTSFDTDGMVTTDFGGNERTCAVAIRTDGKIVTAGYTDGDHLLVLYNTDGSLNMDFGREAADGYTIASSVAIQADNKIVAAGWTSDGNNDDMALVRYNSNGTLDTTFGGSGMATVDFGGNSDGAFAVVIQPDQKIIIAGTGFLNWGPNWQDFALARYNSDGSLDTAFGTGGKVTTNFGSWDYGTTVALQADGKIVMGGYTNVGGSYDHFALARYNSDGSLDTSFDTDGMVITSLTSGYDRIQGVAIQTDGKIVAAGSSCSSTYTDSVFSLVRYNTDGSLDTTFDTDGMLTTSFSGFTDAAANSVAIQTDGKIIAAGYTYTSANTDFALARYNSDGSLDTSFDTDGKVITDLNSNSREGIEAIAILPSGEIAAAGTTRIDHSNPMDFALALYNSNGSLDTSFGAGGKAITNIGGSWDEVHGIAIQPDSKIIVAGSSNTPNTTTPALVRYNYGLTPVAPTVTSITRVNPSPTNLTSVDFTVTFSESVTGVDKDDFKLTTTLTGASITNVSGADNVYTVTVNTGTGNGTIRLDVRDTATIQDLDGYDFTGPYTGGEIYTVVKEVAPVVQSITLAGLNPIDGAGLDFTVTFDKPVTGVDKADFSLTKTGSIMGAAVTKVVPVSQSVYTVTVTSGSGNGSLRLDLPATATIQDLSANAFAGPYTGGETYTIKGPAPTVPVLKLPKNKSLLTTSTPTLDWGDSSQVMALATGWHYEIQVTAPYGTYNETFNTADSADPAVGLGASSFDIPADKSLPANTTFTWRVRAFDAAYRYSAWSKEFTFRTGTAVTPPTEGVPTVPVLKLPKNKSLVAGYTLVLLDWNDSTLPATATPGSLYYEVRVTSPYRNYNASFTPAASEYTIPAENILPANSTFTWQVRSACNDGATTKYSAWSKEFTFRTKLATPTLLSPLDDPDAVTPLDNIRPAFVWEPVSGAATYTLQVLKGSKVVVTGTIKAPAYSFTPTKDLLPNATYTWKVKANGKNPGDYSAPFTIVTGASAPAVPVLTAPKNNALVESADEQTLTWSLVDNATPALSYQVEYDTSAAFTECTVVPAAEKQLILSGGTLQPGRTYYWRVRSWSGADATGTHSPWSKALAIKVKFVAPTLTTPTEGAAVGITPTFTWDSANGLWTNYTLQISTDANFKAGLKNFTIKAPVTTFTLPEKSALIPGTYFWRVKINGVYTPITSEAQSFTVAP